MGVTANETGVIFGRRRAIHLSGLWPFSRPGTAETEDQAV